MTGSLGDREWAALQDIASWPWPDAYRYYKMTMLELEECSLVYRTQVIGKTIYWKITDAGIAALKERRAP